MRGEVESSWSTEGNWKYEYDANHRLLNARQYSDDNGEGSIMLQVSYLYDPFGNRIRESVTKFAGVNSTTETHRFLYDGDTLWADLDDYTSRGGK